MVAGTNAPKTPATSFPPNNFPRRERRRPGSRSRWPVNFVGPNSPPGVVGRSRTGTLASRRRQKNKSEKSRRRRRPALLNRRCTVNAGRCLVGCRSHSGQRRALRSFRWRVILGSNFFRQLPGLLPGVWCIQMVANWSPGCTAAFLHTSGAPVPHTLFQ